MSISRFFTSSATVLRMVPGEDYDGNYQQVESEVCEFPCHVQQASAERAQSLALQLSKTYAIWCDIGTNVQEGDRLQIADRLYTVRALQRNDTGASQHYELTVEYAGSAA